MICWYCVKWFHSHSHAINLSTLQNKDGSYTGFIKVHFQLVRPISLPPPPPPQSLEEDQDRRLTQTKRRTSFYLPKDTAKHLHISSQTRVREVIEALLNKFTLVDNPAKFSLFERTEKQNQGQNPLYCVVTWKQNSTSKYHILKYWFFVCLFVCFTQCACGNCLMMSVPSTCACVLVRVKKSWIWSWRRMRQGRWM